MGVVMGALRATLLALIDSRTRGGTPPSASMTSIPHSCTSQSIFTPVALMHCLVASAISGPTPSPGINVTLYMSHFPVDRLGGYFAPARTHGVQNSLGSPAERAGRSAAETIRTKRGFQGGSDR